MTSKLKTDVLETVSGSGTIALTNQLSGMTHASVPTLTSNHMPAGCVLQRQVSADLGGSASTTSTSFVQVGSWQITNVLSGSTIQIEAHVSHLIEGNLTGTFAIFKGSTELAYGRHTSNGNGGWRAPMPAIVAVDTSPSVGTNSYTLKMKSSGGTVYFNYNHGGSGAAPSYFVTTEIAG